MELGALSVLELGLAGLAAVAGGGQRARRRRDADHVPDPDRPRAAAVAANVTNTIAIAPGHLGRARPARDLAGQRRGLRAGSSRPALLGGLVGGVLLLFTSERVFRQLVPFLILLASGLLAVQEPVRAWLLAGAAARQATYGPRMKPWASIVPGASPPRLRRLLRRGPERHRARRAGLLVVSDSLTRLNAVKQAVGFAANGAAAVLFLFSGQVALAGGRW